MGKRGRTSAAALRLVSTPSEEGHGRRPAPPADLTTEQAEEWKAIVAGMPRDWFRRENHVLLALYCRHAVSARYLSKVRDRIERARKFDLDEYERVAKLIGRETQLLASLATKMRLSQHATYDKKKSKGPSLPAPWED